MRSDTRRSTSTTGTMNVRPGFLTPTTRPSLNSTPSSYCFTMRSDSMRAIRASTTRTTNTVISTAISDSLGLGGRNARGPATDSISVTRMTMPRDVVVVLLDSLNRHLLGCYGGTELDTPNLDRLASRSVRFTNHQAGSLPCIPARHDLLVGALDFPWRPWGSIEVWEDAVTHLLRSDAGISTMLVTDHPHLFEAGGENYHNDFAAWDYVRGHEDDPWRTRPDPSWIGAPALPAQAAPFRRGYDLSRTWFRDEADFPGPKTMIAAAGWLDQELAATRGPDERALLLVDEFDPHEPFDA